MEKEVKSFVKGCVKATHTCKLVVPCSAGSTSYYGICDMGSSINVIPYTLYVKIRHEIYFCELQTIDMDIKLANGTLRKPYITLFDVVLGTFTYPMDFVFIEIPQDDLYPIIFGRYFLNTREANIDCKKRGFLSLVWRGRKGISFIQI